MTYKEAENKAKEEVWIYMTTGTIMSECDVRGFKYKTRPSDGLFCKGERQRCEDFLIKEYIKEYLK